MENYKPFFCKVILFIKRYKTEIYCQKRNLAWQISQKNGVLSKVHIMKDSKENHS